MLGMEFRPTYEEAMLPGGLMMDNMIDGLPSFPPTFDDHNGKMVTLCFFLFNVLFTAAPKINIQTPPKSPQHQFTDDYTGSCDTDPSAPSFLPGSHLDSLLVPPNYYQKSIDTIYCCY